MAERDLHPLELSVETTKRPINPGGEKWLGVVVPVLDHGFVYLVDYMGNDESIEQAARVSYGTGTRTVSETKGLIRYLLRHKHTTPFEMVELKFHAKMPIFVARQWVRHRTAHLNEYSGRYSILDDEFYIPTPEVMATQSKSNRQGREEVFDPVQGEAIRQLLLQDAKLLYEHYEYMLNDDGAGKPVDPERGMLARELARMGLSLNVYTQWYWKVDLHNFFRFESLRMDPHAQWEIQEYARAMARIASDMVPMAWEAFEDYELEALSLTKFEKLTLTALLVNRNISATKEEILNIAENIGLTNKRERQELLDKFRKLGLVEQK